MFKSINITSERLIAANTTIEIAINEVQHTKDILLIAINTVKTLSSMVNEIDRNSDIFIRAIDAVDCAIRAFNNSIDAFNNSIDAVNHAKIAYDTTSNEAAIISSDLMTIVVAYKTSWNMINKFDTSKLSKQI